MRIEEPAAYTPPAQTVFKHQPGDYVSTETYELVVHIGFLNRRRNTYTGTVTYSIDHKLYEPDEVVHIDANVADQYWFKLMPLEVLFYG